MVLTYFNGTTYKLFGKDDDPSDVIFTGSRQKHFNTRVIPICAWDPRNQLKESFLVFNGASGDADIYTFIYCAQDYLENFALKQKKISFDEIEAYHDEN